MLGLNTLYQKIEVSSIPPNTDPRVAEALQAYIDRDYAKSINRFKALEGKELQQTRLMGMAQGYGALGDYGSAAKLYKSLSSSTEDTKLVHFYSVRAGQAFLASGDYKSADLHFRRAISARPHLYEGHYGLIRSAYLQGNYGAARQILAAWSAASRDSQGRQYLAAWRKHLKVES